MGRENREMTPWRYFGVREAGGLRLHGGGISGALVVFAFHLHAFVSHPSFLAALVHVVGPLWAGATAATLSVYEAPPAGRKGSSASSAVVHPGFLPIPIIVLQIGGSSVVKLRGASFNVL